MKRSYSQGRVTATSTHPQALDIKQWHRVGELAAKLVGINWHIEIAFKNGEGSNHRGMAFGSTRCEVFTGRPIKAQETFRTLVHELCHLRDKRRGAEFSGYKRRWRNRPHEKRAVRATDRIVNGDLSPRATKWRAELLGVLAELLDQQRASSPKPSSPKPSSKTDVVFRAKGETAAEMQHLLIDMCLESDEEEVVAFGEWFEDHWQHTHARNRNCEKGSFRCPVKGNERWLLCLADELAYRHDNIDPALSGFNRRAERIRELVDDTPTEEIKP